MKTLKSLGSMALLSSMIAVPLFAEEITQPVLVKANPTAAEVAKELSNPNTTLGSLNFNFDYNSYDGDIPGANGQSSKAMSFQPVLPYQLGEGLNLYVRPNIPIIFDTPVPSKNFEGSGFELGDISFDAAIGKSFPGGLVLIGGIVGTLPTASSDDVGLDQWLLGPEFAIGKIYDWGVLGILVTHQWDIAGDDDFDTSITGGQYFYVFNLEDGWQINGSPEWSYNHEADSDNRLTLPVAAGISKTTIFGSTPWKFNLQYTYNVVKPDNFGQDYQVRFTVTPVVPLPW